MPGIISSIAPLKLSAIAGAASLLFVSLAGAGDIWIESESPANFPSFAATGAPRPELLSGGKVLSVILKPGEVEGNIPADGLILTYPFTAKEAGRYAVWNRVGFEGIRSPFEWRIDDGAWQVNSQAGQPITNVQELGFWNPIGWTQMGEETIKAGPHKLDIRLTRQYKKPDKQEELKELRYLSDAILLTTSPFQPNFQYRPGETFPGESKDKPVFTLKDTGEPRQVLSLDGAWQLAPYDELGEISEESRVAGVSEYPPVDRLSWYTYDAPRDRRLALSALDYVHRFVVRSFVDIPASKSAEQFRLIFESVNMIASLFVNGQKVADFSIVKGQWEVNITPYVKLGSVNEILVVFKDAYYALAPSTEGESMRRNQYYPRSLFSGGNQGISFRMDFPVANGQDAVGLLDSVRLVATTGGTYVADTFIKPYPETRKKIEIETELANPDGAAVSGSILRSVREWPSGKVVEELPAQPFQLAAGEKSAVVKSEMPSEKLKLWWIWQPNLYELVTDVQIGGKTVDSEVTRFGNREWEIRGNQFYLNGVRQTLRADTSFDGAKGDREDAIKAVDAFKAYGENMFRRRFQTDWFGMTPRQLIDFMDEKGLPVRQNAGTFDGQLASYSLAKDKQPRRELFARWREQMLNGVRARRNHPAIFIWELENEIVFINLRNFGNSKIGEPEVEAVAKEVMTLDPTRATVSGGGRALLNDSLPTTGIHYFELEDRHYPEEAYTGELSLKHEGSNTAGRIWPVDAAKKPIFFSETAFLSGRNGASGFAAVGGEQTFLGRRESRPAIGRVAAWLAEGYRWKGYAATHMYFEHNLTDGVYTDAWQPVTILRRQWKDTFGPDEKVRRDLRVYNDSIDASPITAEWKLEIGGEVKASDKKDFAIAPGNYEPWEISFTMPPTDARKDGFLRLITSRGGEKLAERAIPIQLVPESTPKPVKIPGSLVVWDPEGSALARLKATGYKVDRTVNSLQEVPDKFGLLVVGRNAIPKESATDRRWLALASAGNRIVFLEQENPIHFQATQGDWSPSGFDGRIAFSQNLEHPIFEGVEQSDLDFWGDNEVVYRNALSKPTRGASSLVQVDEGLAYTALLESQVGDGVSLVSQLAIGEKLGQEVTARRLFDNMVRYAAGYKKVERLVLADIQNPFLSGVLGSLGLRAEKVTDPIESLRKHPASILLVEGSRENLARLADQPKVLQEFWESGGWIFVLNVTPESLPDFNRIVGYEHIIRKFRQEMVRFPAVPHPLTSGLSLRDVVMSSGKRIQNFNSDEWPTDDAFDYILDLEDVAPFAEFPPPAYWNDGQTTGPGDDTWPLNMVNGFTSATHWRMVFSIHLDKGDPTKWTMKLPRQEKIREIRLIPNKAYHQITETEVTFDGNDATKQHFTIDPQEEAVTMSFDPPVAASSVGLNLSRWAEKGTANVIGVDNLEIIAERPEGFARNVRPLLNIGGLVAYPRGKGGVLLSQYVFRQQEANPQNFEKKKIVLATLLRNLGASFGDSGVAVAGFNLRYQPVSLEGVANLYLTKDQGWPVDTADLSALPRGKNVFAGVTYEIRDFATSPLESAVTLKHPKIKSRVDKDAITAIPLHARADSLFFLHGLLPADQWKPSRPTDKAPSVFNYVVNYEDGSREVIDIVLDREVSSWLKTAEASKSLPGAEIAWQADIPGRKEKATLYQFQWNNPHPERKIASVDLVYGPGGNKYGAPLLLGITAAEIQK